MVLDSAVAGAVAVGKLSGKIALGVAANAAQQKLTPVAMGALRRLKSISVEKTTTCGVCWSNDEGMQGCCGCMSGPGFSGCGDGKHFMGTVSKPDLDNTDTVIPIIMKDGEIQSGCCVSGDVTYSSNPVAIARIAEAKKEAAEASCCCCSFEMEGLECAELSGPAIAVAGLAIIGGLSLKYALGRRTNATRAPEEVSLDDDAEGQVGCLSAPIQNGMEECAE